MILKLLLHSQMVWMILITSLKNTTQIKKHKTLIVFYDVIADKLSNFLLNPIVTELFC